MKTYWGTHYRCEYCFAYNRLFRTDREDERYSKLYICSCISDDRDILYTDCIDTFV